ncbi:MAG: type II toxin-antitoxin system HicB family antitoxin [Acidobacteriota bacterium]|nr:type II toxin-antitoxin system HicB family antitoxin [Acidobacteriota bacterium]
MLRLRLNLSMKLEQEDDVWVALCPELDVASQGETVEEAADMLDEAVRLFLETCHEMGTLSEVLAESGVTIAVAGEADDGPEPVAVPMELVIGARQASQADAH